MGHYVKYEGNAERKAIIDCIHWLGVKDFKMLVRLMRKYPDTKPHEVRMGLMMMGIQGYPAEAVIERYL